MNCPNCGTYYTENEKICKKCHTPLSNAIYNPVEHAEDNQNTSNKKKRFAPIIAVLLIFASSQQESADTFTTFPASSKDVGMRQNRFLLMQKYGFFRCRTI